MKSVGIDHGSNPIYEDIVENSPLCIKVFDSNGKLIFINSGGRKEHSIKSKDVIQKWNWINTVAAEDREHVKKAFEDALNGVASRIEYQHTPGESDHEWCWGIISPVKNSDGSIKNVLFYSLDISLRKKMEKELEGMNKVMIDRELKMIELKDTIENLKSELKKRNHL